jgi:RNA polymerase sigma factor (TIGR02999 family)
MDRRDSPSDTVRRSDRQEERQGGALDDLIPLVYQELRRTAHRELARRRPGATLDTSALVHEAYIKLARPGHVAWSDTPHFFAVAATAMRHIIIDYALKKGAAKRGGGRANVPLDERLVMPEEQAEELLALDAALERLEQVDARLSRVVECRYFGGLTVPETAAALECSARTVDRDWRKAKAWLFRELSGD